MRVYEATVVDKCANPSGEEPVSYESYVAVGTGDDMERQVPAPYTDEDIHYYFTEDEFKLVDGEIETEEFKYLIGKRVA